MKKIFFALSFAFLLSGCDVLQNLPTSIGTVTEGEAGQGIKEALSQGLANAVLQLNKEDGFLKMPCTKFYYHPMQRRLRTRCGQWAWAI